MLPAEIALPAQTAQWLKAYRLGGRSSGRVSNRSGVGRWAFRPPDSELCYAPYAQILPPHAARAALAVVQGPAAAAGVVLAGACAVLLVLRGEETAAESARCRPWRSAEAVQTRRLCQCPLRGRVRRYLWRSGMAYGPHQPDCSESLAGAGDSDSTCGGAWMMSTQARPDRARDRPQHAYWSSGGQWRLWTFESATQRDQA